MQKYRFDRDGKPLSNGSVPIYTDWQHGPTLAGVRNCPLQVNDTEMARRTVYVQGEQVYAGAWEARYRFLGRSRKGTLAVYETGFVLHMGNDETR